MTKVPCKNVLYGTLGVCMGLGGIMSQMQCNAGGCGTCFGCAWTGISVVAAALAARKNTHRKEEDHGAV